MGENTLGPIIKKIRKQKNLTQTELGNLIGYSQNTVSNHENQKRALSEKGISKYAAALGTTPQELFMKSQPDSHSHVSKTYYDYYNADFDPTLVNSPVSPEQDPRIQHLTAADILLGKYAHQKDIFITRINSESMNRVIPNKALIIVKRINQWQELQDGDIIIVQTGDDLDVHFSVKYYYYNNHQQLVALKPDSSDKNFTESYYSNDELENIKIIGKIVSYTVQL